MRESPETTMELSVWQGWRRLSSLPEFRTELQAAELLEVQRLAADCLEVMFRVATFRVQLFHKSRCQVHCSTLDDPDLKHPDGLHWNSRFPMTRWNSVDPEPREKPRLVYPSLSVPCSHRSPAPRQPELPDCWSLVDLPQDCRTRNHLNFRGSSPATMQ